MYCNISPVFIFYIEINKCLINNVSCFLRTFILRCYVQLSIIPSANEGLFSKIKASAGEVMSFYNGIRLGHEEVLLFGLVDLLAVDCRNSCNISLCAGLLLTVL